MRFLLVEDSLTDAKLLERWLKLERLACVLELIRDGEEARQRLLAAPASAPPFDLVVLDQNLPGCSGSQILTAAKSAPGGVYRDVPFVLFLDASPEVASQFAQLPGCHVLCKPRDASDYEALVHRLRQIATAGPDRRDTP